MARFKIVLCPINVLSFNLCRLIPLRNKKIWLFGGWEGHKYDDNSRFLFEYVSGKKGVQAIWLSNDKDVVEKVRKTGRKAFLSSSIKGKYYSIRAGVAVYSHGLMDFGHFPLIGGAKIISLWHGVGFKKIYNDKYSGIKLFMKRFMDKLYSWTYRDITFVTSDYVKKQFSGIFGLKSSSKIMYSGQPRNDIFKQNLQKEKVLSKLSLDFSKRVIIYMPTYRGKDMGENAMENIIRTLYESDRLNEVLEKEKCVFIAKLHPLTPHIDIPSRENFVILDYGEVDSNQELLGVSDMLITDYSSCCVDFALLNRPIIFYQPDEEDFMKKSEPLYEELLDILHTNRCTTPDELAERILNPTLEAVNIINDVFEDESIRGTCYSENVYKVICDEIGLQDK
jgi:CDP-glycerol glycerophosphotransferase (TagB/SpsB family)